VEGISPGAQEESRASSGEASDRFRKSTGWSRLVAQANGGFTHSRLMKKDKELPIIQQTYSGFQVRAPRVVRLLKRRPNLAGVSR
jgi:hypothetical protein